ncbi:hypothetical protein WJR50_23835 [Catalinimonas sp. 4WD22]|uniref:hypothetical protein n=1 Tax=Catalinimonas locisalis TaxID=3133978 RepID=UPI003101B12F
MKIRRVVLQRLMGFTLSLMFTVLSIHNFFEAWGEMILWKMVFSVIGFMGFFWIGSMAYQQLFKLLAEDE